MAKRIYTVTVYETDELAPGGISHHKREVMGSKDFRRGFARGLMCGDGVEQLTIEGDYVLAISGRKLLGTIPPGVTVQFVKFA